MKIKAHPGHHSAGLCALLLMVSAGCVVEGEGSADAADAARDAVSAGSVASGEDAFAVSSRFRYTTIRLVDRGEGPDELLLIAGEVDSSCDEDADAPNRAIVTLVDEISGEAPITLPITPDGNTGSYHPGGSGGHSMIRGAIIFEAYQEGSVARGALSFTLTDGRELEGAFDARWCPPFPWPIDGGG